MPFIPVPEAIEEIRAGRILVVVDDEDRENEGDLTIAAEKVTPQIINFMATHGRGLICLALTGDRCDELRLPLISPQNTSNFGTAFCESVDARYGVTTGISAADRTNTILACIHAATEADSRVMASDPLQAFDVNVEGTRHALEFARQAGVRRFLFTSSGAVYGSQPPELRCIPEQFPGGPDPTDSNSIYGIPGEAKRAARLL